MRHWVAPSLIICATILIGGCGPAPSTDPDDYVGEYVFTQSVDPGTFASFVALRKDGTAVEIRFDKATGQFSTRETKWQLTHTTGENVAIADFVHPVERSGRIRLLINEDLNEYYEKIR